MGWAEQIKSLIDRVDCEGALAVLLMDQDARDSLKKYEEIWPDKKIIHS